MRVTGNHENFKAALAEFNQNKNLAEFTHLLTLVATISDSSEVIREQYSLIYTYIVVILSSYYQNPIKLINGKNELSLLDWLDSADLLSKSEEAIDKLFVTVFHALSTLPLPENSDILTYIELTLIFAINQPQAKVKMPSTVVAIDEWRNHMLTQMPISTCRKLFNVSGFIITLAGLALIGISAHFSLGLLMVVGLSLFASAVIALAVAVVVDEQPLRHEYVVADRRYYSVGSRTGVEEGASVISGLFKSRELSVEQVTIASEVEYQKLSLPHFSGVMAITLKGSYYEEGAREFDEEGRWLSVCHLIVAKTALQSLDLSEANISERQEKVLIELIRASSIRLVEVVGRNPDQQTCWNEYIESQPAVTAAVL